MLLVFLTMVIFAFGGCGGDGGGGSAATATASLQVAPTTVVLGADNPLVDVPAVQSAVDQGGTVILGGTFDFGTDAGNHIIVPGRTGAAQDRKGESTVFIYRKDVTIKGETGSKGELLTVVKNGMPAFWIGWDGEVSREPPPGTPNVDFGIETFPVDVAGRVNYRDTGPEPGYTGPQTRYARAFQNVSAKIQTIFFDSPKHYGVKATAGRDVFVIGNVFSKVRFGGLVHLNNFAGATHLAGGFAGLGQLYAPFVVPAITGDIVAERNIVDDVGTETIDTHAGECLGLGAIGTGAAVRIERNEVRNVGRKADGMGPNVSATSIFLIDNYKTSPIVAHNIVYNSSGSGIWDLVIFNSTPGPMIQHNALVDCEIGIMTYSFVGPMAGRLIHQNSFSQDGLLGEGQSCIVANQLSESLIRANRFEGDYDGPLVALLNSSNNVLLENRDSRSTAPPESPTYFLDMSSSGNLIRSASGTALDLGADNKIFLQSPGEGHDP
jgi:hypothetical protein